VTDIKNSIAQSVSADCVTVDPDALASYSSDLSFVRPMMPKAVVKPKSSADVKALVAWARETETPLVPVSSGGPRLHGDTVPSVPDAVIADLSGMDRILSVNRQHRMVVVEPGVTYGKLQSELAKEGMTLATSLAPRATKSVLASTLEVEPRLNSIHQWNYMDPLRCMEVVWGDGNLMFTGEAGGAPRDLKTQWDSEKWQVSGTGPMMLDFYRLLTSAQGTMGIVTWASLKCELLPQIHKMFFASADHLTDLIDFVYRVIHFRFSDELFILNRVQLANLMGESREEIDSLRRDLPAWTVLIGIAGRELLPEERVRAHETSIRDIAQEHGQTLVSSLPGVRAEDALEKVINPSGETYWKQTYKGAFDEIFFSTTLDRTPGFIEAMYAKAVEVGYPVGDIGVYIQPQNMGTSYHLEFSLPYAPDNAAEKDLASKLFHSASEMFAAMGAYYSRPYGIWSRLQLNKDAQSYQTLTKLRGIFDPQGIMNPGKLAI